MLIIGVAVLILFFLLKKKKSDPLDRVLHTWPSGDTYTVRHTLTNLMGVGATGSGKSSGTGRWVMKCLLSVPRSGGVIFGSKPEELAEMTRHFKAAGRLDDLIVFSPNHPARYNLLEYEQAAGADARSLTQLLMCSAEVLEEGGKASDPFWALLQSRVLWNAIELLRQANGRVTAPLIAQIVDEAAYSPEQLEDARWRGGMHNRALVYATEAKEDRKNGGKPDPIADADYEVFYPFWSKEFPCMDAKPRSSVLAGLQNTLMTFNSGITREVLSTKTNTTPGDLMKGKWWFFDFPVHLHGPSGKFLMSLVKMSVQKAVLRRQAKPGESPVYLYMDEAHNLINSFDSAYMAESRSHGGGTVMMSQSLHSFHNSMEAHGHHKTLGLMTNFSHMLVNSLGDYESSKFFSDLCGVYRESFVSTNSPPQQDPWDVMLGLSQASYSVSTQYCPCVQPHVFLSGLRNGGPRNKYTVDAVLIRTEPFRDSGQRFQLVSFKQR